MFADHMAKMREPGVSAIAKSRKCAPRGGRPLAQFPMQIVLFRRPLSSLTFSIPLRPALCMMVFYRAYGSGMFVAN